MTVRRHLWSTFIIGMLLGVIVVLGYSRVRAIRAMSGMQTKWEAQLADLHHLALMLQESKSELQKDHPPAPTTVPCRLDETTIAQLSDMLQATIDRNEPSALPKFSKH